MKNIAQIAVDERRYNLLPLLMHEKELTVSAVDALLSSFNLSVAAFSVHSPITSVALPRRQCS
jgi:hypothetical protein